MHEVDDAGRAAGRARGGAHLEVVGADRAHEAQLHVDVRVDEARQDELPRGVDRLVAGPGSSFVPIAVIVPSSQAQVGHEALRRGDDLAVA